MIEKQRLYLYRELSRLKLKYIESCTNFILVDVGKNGEKVMQQLMKNGIIVRGMGFWGLKKFIRVTIGASTENKKFIKALEAIL